MKFTQSATRLMTLGAILALAACQPSGSNNNQEAAMESAPVIQTIDGLQITDLIVGDGATAESGQTIVVHYTGWLYDPTQPDNKGSKFDSSVDRGQPFEFPLGAGRVIKGWDQGFSGMQVGGKRLLVIPPEMGYGSRGTGPIPPNATLMFEVELLDTK
jgi:FKBP-type peptidyl-prolyl cis-trans isomerase